MHHVSTAAASSNSPAAQWPSKVLTSYLPFDRQKDISRSNAVEAKGVKAMSYMNLLIRESVQRKLQGPHKLAAVVLFQCRIAG